MTSEPAGRAPDAAGPLDRLAARLRTETGLVLDANRRAVLRAAVAEGMARAGVDDPDAFVRVLGTGAGAAAWQRLVDDVTIQETHFFRIAPQMDALAQVLLPELLARPRAGRPLTVWSAGCSTGEEPYSLAMVALDLLGPAAAREVRILGTDISSAAVAAAARGRYGPRTVRHMPEADRERWLRPAPGGGWLVADEVRELVDIRRHNLVGDPPPFGAGEVDLLVCRNVTIYFDRRTTRDLVGGWLDVLRDHGYLLLGPAETLWQVSDAYELVPVGAAFAYRRPARRAVAPRPAEGTVATPAADRRAAVPAVALARRALREGRYADAVAAAAAVTRADPLAVEAYAVAGHALSSLGRDGDAVGPLRKAVYLDPGHGVAQLLLAGALSRTGSPAAAARAYRAAAGTLAGASAEQLREVLDGRDVRELVLVCHRLADMLTEDADQRRAMEQEAG